MSRALGGGPAKCRASGGGPAEQRRQGGGPAVVEEEQDSKSSLFFSLGLGAGAPRKRAPLGKLETLAAGGYVGKQQAGNPNLLLHLRLACSCVSMLARFACLARSPTPYVRKIRSTSTSMTVGRLICGSSASFDALIDFEREI
ncbi:hypothetical protein IEQ34_005624 [Dendrobium chrysotoxum]|uniref:Uncharacterized protein n=1 Tax=Dendrobium chrysotoxum TaxID=161865 RepID=A0AAV7H9F3_DENCH|nr:hypothetical protein IEQ34_005624 [Dendrobium chrysotoxum]